MPANVISFLNLPAEYKQHQKKIDAAIRNVLQSGQFINGKAVKEFSVRFGNYLSANHVIPCANGTEALQIALMALALQPGDEVILPAFTYAAPIEVVCLLGLKPVLVDVNYHTFNINVDEVERRITKKTKAIIPVHLFGQSTQLEPLLELAKAHNLYIIEDNAQGAGIDYRFANGKSRKTGTIGDMGCFSFFPSKNLACYGDGGAITTQNEVLAERAKKIARHGQSQKYHHEAIGLNSRLDTLQAAVLNVKLTYLNQQNAKRQQIAATYNDALKTVEDIVLPKKVSYSSHIYHQYTIRVKNQKRDALKQHLAKNGVSTMVYYPLPLHKQKAYKPYLTKGKFPIAGQSCEETLSLPVHPYLSAEEVGLICKTIESF